MRWPLSWYISNRKIHEDLGVPFFADHFRALTDSFDSKLADAGNPVVRQLGRYLRWMGTDPSCMKHTQAKGDWSQQASRGGQVDRRNRAQHCSARHFSATLTEVFPWLFPGCKVNARVQCKDGARAAFPLTYGVFNKSSFPLSHAFGCSYATLISDTRKHPNQSMPPPPRRLSQ